MAIEPGQFTDNPEDYTQFVNSMAAEIEGQLNELLGLDHLPALPDDADDREVRDRRRLFVAIARAVVIHLNDRRLSINIEVPDGIGGTVTVHPTFDIAGV